MSVDVGELLCFVMEVGGGDNEQVRHLVGRDGVQVVVVDGLPVGNLQLGFGCVECYHHAFLLVGSQTCDIGCIARKSVGEKCGVVAIGDVPHQHIGRGVADGDASVLVGVVFGYKCPELWLLVDECNAFASPDEEVVEVGL